jgi:hypothetical protein
VCEEVSSLLDNWQQHAGTLIGRTSRFAAISKQIKEFRCWRNTVSLGIRVAFHSVARTERRWGRGAMGMILIFTGKWNRWYRVLRYGKGFGLFDSVRYGLWLARG